MGIDWEKGEVNPEPHILRPDQVAASIDTMEAGDVCYMDIDDCYLTAGPDGSLWIDRLNITLTEEEVKEEYCKGMQLCRVIKTDDGMVLDLFTGGIEFSEESQTQLIREWDVDRQAEGRYVPVVGLIETEKQLSRFTQIMFEKYSLFLGESVLSRIIERDDSDD